MRKNVRLQLANWFQQKQILEYIADSQLCVTLVERSTMTFDTFLIGLNMTALVIKRNISRFFTLKDLDIKHAHILM